MKKDVFAIMNCGQLFIIWTIYKRVGYRQIFTTLQFREYNIIHSVSVRTGIILPLLLHSWKGLNILPECYLVSSTDQWFHLKKKWKEWQHNRQIRLGSCDSMAISLNSYLQISLNSFSRVKSRELEFAPCGGPSIECWKSHMELLRGKTVDLHGCSPWAKFEKDLIFRRPPTV